jgi:CheY-like chemotaxis protein
VQEPARVLIADDEPAARYGLVRALSNQGYELREAGNGAEAYAALETFHPDVVLSDINMPGMDGLTLLRRVNELGETAPLVVLITAYGSESVAVEALRAGAHDYLAKPFELDDLRKVIRQAVEKQRLLRENRAYYRQLRATLEELKRSQVALVQAEKMAFKTGGGRRTRDQQPFGCADEQPGPDRADDRALAGGRL